MKLSDFKPTYLAPEVEAITFQALQANELGHIKYILWDFGGTLREHQAKELESTVIALLKALQGTGMRQAIHSNVYGERRIRAIREMASVDGLKIAVLTPATVTPAGKDAHHYSKPRPDMIKKVIAEEKIAPKEILVVGDQITKDVLAANRIGACSILVPRRGSKDDWRIKLFQRPIERMIYAYLKLPRKVGQLTKV